MEKVLLAINGVTPSKKVFSFAVQLCQRIRAELNVLQVVRPRNYGKYLKNVRKKANHAKKYIESSLVSAAFAEAGEHETARDMLSEASENINRLLPESEKAGIRCHLTMKLGNPDNEIISYVNEHRDVVLTIYDAPGETDAEKKDKTVAGEIKENLPVPLVTIIS